MICFQAELQNLSDQQTIDAAMYIENVVGVSKAILLSNRVQNFTAADVVELTKIIIDEARQYGL